MVGFDVGVNVIDVSEFDLVSVNFKLHRRLPEDIAIAVGIDDAIFSGDRDDIIEISPYLVITKVFRLRDSPQDLLSRLYISAGVGAGRYRSEADIFDSVNSVGRLRQCSSASGGTHDRHC